MEDLLAARCQMGMSLVFHIVFAAVGIAMPLMMVVAEFLWLKTGESTYLILAKRWAKGTAILFAVGAVSGTVLSFELGLLWPKFMQFAGSIIGMPFSLEGFAFFTEAIFLGIYLYGWQKVSDRMHLLSGLLVSLSGAASGLFVVIANAWMNTPTGFVLRERQVANVDPVQAMFNPNAFPQCLHMIIASYAATGFAVAGIHAWSLLRQPHNSFHRQALLIALTVGGAAALIEPLSGDLLAQAVAHNQPLKLAAFEGQFKTERAAPLRLGGLPDEQAQVTRFALDIPYGLSILAYHDPQSEVKGLEAFPKTDWPPVLPVHLAFQIMVMSASVMVLTALWFFWLSWRRQTRQLSQRFLKLVVMTAPLGFLAIEAGWIVTELGRQPWVIYGVMKTADAVTPMPGLVVPFIMFTLLYLLLSVAVVWLMFRQVIASPTIVDPQQPGG